MTIENNRKRLYSTAFYNKTKAFSSDKYLFEPHKNDISTQKKGARPPTGP